MLFTVTLAKVSQVFTSCRGGGGQGISPVQLLDKMAHVLEEVLVETRKESSTLEEYCNTSHSLKSHLDL